MTPPRRHILGVLLLLGAAVGTHVSGQTKPGESSRPVVRFLIASAGGFDQSGFADEYAKVLDGVEFKVVNSPRQGTRLELLQSGDVDLTINVAQSAYLAFSGQIESRQPFDRLRAIAALGVVPLHLVVRNDSGIHSVSDLRGRAINISDPVGENARLAESVMTAFGVPAGSYRPHNAAYAGGAAKLINGEVEAMFVVGEYPGRAVTAATEGGLARLLPIDGPPANRLRLNSGFIHPALIPAGSYPGQQRSIRTIGVQHLLVTRQGLDETLAYELTKQLFVALPRLSSHISSLRLMDVDLASATTIPLHDGAARYYRERELSR